MKSIVLVLILVFSLNGARLEGSEKALRIAVSKYGDRFTEFLKVSDTTLEVVDLFRLSEEASVSALQQCSGLILSGGLDIDPVYYGRPEKAHLCVTDPERDRREWDFLKIAIERQIPILGICRGFQLLNVFFGGTLIADIPTETDSNVTHRISGGFAYHYITIQKGTLLSRLAPFRRVVVNSNHHQGIDLLADPFLASARSSDQLIEAFEWKDKKDHPFLLAVLWHPEHMTDTFSRRIASAFIEAARKENNKMRQQSRRAEGSR